MKRTYHTDFCLQYKLGLMDKDLARQIPRSTLFNWRQRDFNHLFGTEHIDFTEEKIELIREFLSRKQFFITARAMYTVFKTWQRLVVRTKEWGAIIKESKDIVVETIDNVKEVLGVKRAVLNFGISIQQYYIWKRDMLCFHKDNIVCYRRSPGQISVADINSIRTYLLNKDYIHWSMGSVYYKMLREGVACMSLSTFYRYARMLDLSRLKPRRRRRPAYEGLQASRPGEYLHLDVSKFRILDNTMVHLYFLVDNYSRYIMGWRATLRYSSAVTRDLMKEVYEKYRKDQLKLNVDLIVDDGSENKGQLDDYLDGTLVSVNKLVARKDISFSNSMVEAVNKQMKYDYLFTRDFNHIREVVEYLRDFAINDYHHKPHSRLHGLTPHEVFNGSKPDPQVFREKIKEAVMHRFAINKGFRCEDCQPMTACI